MSYAVEGAKSSELSQVEGSLVELNKTLEILQNKLYAKVASLIGDFPIGVEPMSKTSLSDTASVTKPPTLISLRMAVSDLQRSVSLLEQTITTANGI